MKVMLNASPTPLLSSLILSCAVMLSLTAGAGILGGQSSAKNQPEETPQANVEVADPTKQAKKDVARTDLHGDPLPEGAIARLGTVRLRHGAGIFGIAYSPDGKLLACGGMDHAVRLWNVATGREVRRLSVSADEVRSLAFSPDGTTLAASSGDRTVGLWEVASGKELLQLAGHQNSVVCVAFSPDGAVLASGSWDDPPLILWDTRTGKQLRQLTGTQRSVEHVRFSPDGKTLFATDRKTVQVWDVATGKALRTLRGRDDFGQGLALSPDGKTLALGSYGQAILLWDAATGQELRQLAGERCGVCALAFSPNGKILASAGYHDTFRLWDVATGKELHCLVGHSTSVVAVAFSPDGKTLASGSWDNTIRFWDVASGKEISSRYGHQAPLESLAVSPDGKTVVTASYDRTLRIWEAATGKELRVLAGHNGTPKWTTFSLDGKEISSAGLDGSVRRWDRETGKEQKPLLKHPSICEGVAFARDGRMIATGGDGGGRRIHLWETASRKEVRQLQGCRPLALSPDGDLLACKGLDHTTWIWQPLQGRVLRQFGPCDYGSYALSFSPDGRMLATAHYEDRELFPIFLWEVATGKQFARLVGPPGSVLSLCFSPNGRVLAAAGSSTTIDLWDLPAGKLQRRFSGHQGQIVGLAFTADGKKLASASADTTALLWDVSDWGSKIDLSAVKLSPLHLDTFWTDLAGADAPKAYRAIWSVVAGRKQAVPFLREQLQSFPFPCAAKIDKLVADLDSDRFAVRQKATAELVELGEWGETALRKLLKGEATLEASRRAALVLKKLADPVNSPKPLRVGRVLQALELIGTPEAREVLDIVAERAVGLRPAHDARASLKRLAKRSSMGP